jgi:hypothetical protein
MPERILADATVAFHFAFILFVVGGGALVWRRPAWAWLHVPAVAWVVWLEFTHAICPLTPLENLLRARAGDAGYAGGFIEHYLEPVIYPGGLTPGIQVILGALVVILNIVVYAFAWRRARRAGSPRGLAT